MDLLDKSGGQIRATMFNEVADRLNEMFEVNKVYIISKGQLKLANKRYNTLPNEYELTLNNDCEVEACGEDKEIEEQKYVHSCKKPCLLSVGFFVRSTQHMSVIPNCRFAFVSIDQLESIQPDDVVDIYGVVKDVQPIAHLVSKKTQRELTKRLVQLFIFLFFT